jgi:cell cycle checkpoint protein
MSLQEVWQAASASPFAPVISKDNHFLVGFSLLLFGKKAERESPVPG